MEKREEWTVIEQTCNYTIDGHEKLTRAVTEKSIDDERVNMNHIVVPPGEAGAAHVSTSWLHTRILERYPLQKVAGLTVDTGVT